MQKRQVKEFVNVRSQPKAPEPVSIAYTRKFSIVFYFACLTFITTLGNQIFSKLVDHCFMSCIDDFSSKALNSRESGCIQRCVIKDMAAQQRLGERFQELSAQMANQQQQ